MLEKTTVNFGIDVLLAQNPIWKKQKVALVTNLAAHTNQLTPTSQALVNAGFNLVKLFSPEHGFSATAADGQKVANTTDVLSKLPIVSLYGKNLAPTAQDLANVDLVLFDIADVGVRFYTYLWTLTHVLEACAKYKKRIIVLDRPNPLSGKLALSEGPMLNEKACSSFIGRWNIPLRHSCTLGELAIYFNETKNINATLEVIACKNWNRNQFHPNWGIKFIAPSPAISNFNAALLYAGLGLLEAINLSEGRGTEHPFEQFGAPWLSNFNLTELNTTNISLTPTEFIPKQGKYANQECYGFKFNVKDATNFKSVNFGLLLIKLIKDQYPAYFNWSNYPTNVNPSGKNHLDKLLGIAKSELIFEQPLLQFKAAINSMCNSQAWQKLMQPYLLYN